MSRKAGEELSRGVTPTPQLSKVSAHQALLKQCTKVWKELIFHWYVLLFQELSQPRQKTAERLNGPGAQEGDLHRMQKADKKVGVMKECTGSRKGRIGPGLKNQYGTPPPILTSLHGFSWSIKCFLSLHLIFDGPLSSSLDLQIDWIVILLLS